MNTSNPRLGRILILGLLLLPLSAQARSTPVTVVNDATAPVPVDIINDTTPGRFVYVGRSATDTAPDIGNLGLNQLCAATYPGGRMCTTAELILTGNPPPSSGNQWLAPTFTGAVIGSEVVDFSGLVGTPAGLSCGSTAINEGPFSLTTGTGIVYQSSAGRILKSGCNGIRPVACCAPQ